MKILIRWFILTLAVLATPYIAHGVQVNSFLTALVVAALLGFVNTVVKPVIKVLTLPINLLTFGLFSIVLNGLFFWMISVVVPGFSVGGFGNAVWGAIVVSVLHWIINKAFGEAHHD